jgi:DNA-binding PadR family transcriptional regulator
MLEELEFAVVQSVEGEVRKRYAITSQGRQWLRQHADALSGLRARMAIDARAMNSSVIPESIRQAMRTLKHRLISDQGAWPEARSHRVLKAIERAIVALDTAEHV